MAAIKTQILVPGFDFKPSNLPFGVVSGDGVTNYSKDGKEFTVTITLGKKEAKAFEKEVMDFWNENRADGPKAPDNFKTMLKKSKSGSTVVYIKSLTHFPSGDENTIAIVDAKKSPLDPTQYGTFGGETEGRVAVGLSIYPAQGTPKGVSRYINAVQITAFQKGGSSKASGFGEEEGEALAGEGVAAFDDAPKKKKKKKKSKD